jgi:hypothetical protein
MLIITGVMFLIFSVIFANTDLIGASEGVSVGFMKFALGIGFMTAAFIAGTLFGIVGLTIGITVKDWSLFFGLIIALLLYIPTFLLYYVFSLSIIHLGCIRSGVVTFCIFCIIPCIILIAGFLRKPRKKTTNKVANRTSFVGPVA